MEDCDRPIPIGRSVGEGEIGIRLGCRRHRSGLVGKGRVIRPLHSGFDADVVVDSEPELLLQPR
jgi:hypothetical protein